MAYSFEVYILTNYNKTVLYTGVTKHLPQRLLEHYQNRGKEKSFTGRYHCHYLLYYESFKYIDNAIAREKQIKGWTRQKKMDLIASFNPSFDFLNKDLCGEWPPKDM